MASLLTPGENIYLQSQRNPDWLAEMVFKGQQMRQQQVQLDQAQQRIEQARQLAAVQAEQYWAEQARLKDQQSFQNKKFLFEVGKDQRDAERQKVLDERNWQNVQADNARQVEALNWDRSPDNPMNKAREASIGATKTNAQLDWAKAVDEGIVSPDQQPPFASDAPTNWEGNAASETPTGAPGISPGAYSLLGEPPPDDVQRPATNPATPDVNVIEVAPGVKAAAITQKSATGRPKSTYLQFLPATKPAADPDEKDIEHRRKELADLSGKLAAPPSAPYNDGGELTSDQKRAYEERRAAVKARNAPIVEQIKQVQGQLNDTLAKKRLGSTEFQSGEMTEDFQKEVAPELMRAIEKKDPTALRTILPKIQALAKTGDASAVKALEYLNQVLDGGGGPVAKPTRSGYYE